MLNYTTNKTNETKYKTPRLLYGRKVSWWEKGQQKHSYTLLNVINHHQHYPSTYDECLGFMLLRFTLQRASSGSSKDRDVCTDAFKAMYRWLLFPGCTLYFCIWYIHTWYKLCNMVIMATVWILAQC